MKRIGAFGLFLAIAAACLAANGDPREANFRILVDGAPLDGVVGYRIEYIRNPVAISTAGTLPANHRRLLLTVTQKGLNRLQDWLNGATDPATASPATKTVSVQALDNSGQLLARWDLAGVAPSSFTSQAAGTISEVDSTVEFAFDKLTLVEASAK